MTYKPDPFESAKAVFKQACKRATDVKRHLDEFESNTDPGEVIIEAGSNDIGYIKVQFSHQIPISLSITIRDVFRDLKSALDQACYASAVAKHGKALTSGTYFPFSTKKENLPLKTKSGSLPRSCYNLPKEIYEFAVRCCPYSDEDGNKLLFETNSMRNADEHRFLSRLGVKVEQMHAKSEINFHNIFDEIEWNGENKKTVHSFEINPILSPIWDEAANQLTVAWFDTRIIKEPSCEISTYLCFGEVGTFKGHRPMEIISPTIDMINFILSNIEKISYDIGLFDS